MIADIIKKNRSYRRFYQHEIISEQDLRDMVDAARLCPSARNAQTLCYFLSHTAEMNAAIFPALRWAAYLTNWDGPEDGERPSAYIVILNDNEISNHYFCDHGIASLAMLLTAVEKGYGGCIIASVDGNHLREVLNIPMRYSILQVIALGKPKETVVIEPMPDPQDYKYWRGAQGIHHVPKRDLDDIILQ